jgi:hypothetical protein
MNGAVAPSIFESFNARNLDPEKVAETFVPSKQYEDLIKRRHTLIVGPRGSGKTTLLKMLQEPALEAWKHDGAEYYRSKIDFTGVFIPTDISWGEQLRLLGAESLDGSSRRLLSVATFTTHILRCLIRTIMRRRDSPGKKGMTPFRRILLSAEAEARLASQLCKLWHISDAVPSLLSLRQALSARFANLYSVASREVTLGEKGRQGRLADIEYLHLHFLRNAGLAVELLDDCLGEASGKWALMFDELELAPPWIQDELAQSLRSTDDRFLFKLALNPFTPNDSLLKQTQAAPASGHDFDQIALWYVKKKDALEFCRQLWFQMLDEKNIRRQEPEKVFGGSYFQTVPDDLKESGSRYGPHARITNRFRALAEKDTSFRSYLQQNDIRLDALDAMDDNKRAAKIRKIAPIVAIREFYRQPEVRDMEVGAQRSRKTAKLYSGSESLFSITEGNPRWFIAIVERLLERWDPDRSKKIDFSVQGEEILAASERFQAMLETIPIPEGTAPDDTLGVLSVVSRAANFFHDQLVKGPFKADAWETFEVDAKVPGEILAGLGRAANAGAIVLIPDGDRLILATERDLIGKRFRVSYLLAPIYGLALRLGKSVSLTAILSDKKRSSRLPPGDSQLKIPLK